MYDHAIYFVVDNLRLHTVHSTASFLLKVAIEVDEKVLFVRNIDTDDVCLSKPGSDKSVSVDALRTVLANTTKLHGIHSVGRMRFGGSDALFEVDFATPDDIQKYLLYRIISLDLQKEISRLFRVSSNTVNASCVLYLATPQVACAQKECRLIEVTIENYEDCVQIYCGAMVFGYKDASDQETQGIYMIRCTVLSFVVAKLKKISMEISMIYGYIHHQAH